MQHNQPGDLVFAIQDFYRSRWYLAQYILAKAEYLDNIDAPTGSRVYRDYKNYLQGMLDLYNHATDSFTTLESLREEFRPRTDLDTVRENNKALMARQEGPPPRSPF